jgi:L-ribulose-5-phosphate 4-epimerase
MPAHEGVVQFGYTLTQSSPPHTSGADFAELQSWRSILHGLSLLGQSDDLYDGFAYGNLSMRRPDMGTSFLISATQTGGLEHTVPEDWVLIEHYDLATFQVVAVGQKPPSSESMTHAMVYAADSDITCVLHVHNHDIWGHAEALGLATTGSETRYGSPALAQEVSRLLIDNPVRPLVFTTPGHEDGVFACGADLEETSGALIRLLAAARTCQS